MTTTRTLPDGSTMTTVALACTIPGTPQQQGSKTRNAYGTMYEANRNLKPWRAHAITQLRAAWAGEPITHGVHVTARFVYARPKSHYRTGRNSHLLRDDAPAFKTSAPDLDHLQRALGDALTQAGVLRDDALIAQWTAAKLYGPTPLVELTITRC